MAARSKKLYMLIRAVVPPEMVRQFNEVWGKESLPYWLKQGAKHIGSFDNYAGGPRNEILRLFEFESLSHWEKFQDDLAGTPQGKRVLKTLSPFNLIIERRLLRSVY